MRRYLLKCTAEYLVPNPNHLGSFRTSLTTSTSWWCIIIFSSQFLGGLSTCWGSTSSKYSAVVLATTVFFQKKFVKLKFLIIIFRWIPNAEDLLRLQVVATTILNTLNGLWTLSSFGLKSKEGKFWVIKINIRQIFTMLKSPKCWGNDGKTTWPTRIANHLF